MAETGVVFDRAQVKKAVQALQAFLKTKSKQDSLFPDDTQQISVLFTFWRIPRETQTIRIPLPHGQRTDTEEVCLFTRDEPKMTSEQTQRFYKRLLEEKGVTNVTEIIPYKVLKTEYKPYEAKRRLLGNFAMFISDDRIRRLLPSHIGKHFYLSKKEPLCVNLQSKHLARDIQRIIQGTRVKVTNKGSCCMARVAHSGMTADEVTENIEAAIQTVAAKIRMKGPVMKVIHIKSQRSVALPIYTSDLSNFSVLDGSKKNAKNQKFAVKKWTKKNKTKDIKKDTTEDVKQDTVADVMEDIKKDTTEDVKQDKTEDVKEDTEDVKQTDITAEDEEEKEIPELVPIATPMKKPKLEKPSKKKKLEKAPESSVKKSGMKTRSSLTKKADSKVKGKVPKVK